MEYVTLELLFQYSVAPFGYLDHQDSDAEHGLEKLLDEKAQSLIEILNQIDNDVKARRALSLNVIYRIYQHYCYLKCKLFELYTWELGRSRNVEKRRSSLEQQLDALKQEKRQEQVHCWQDIARLRTELRTWFKQYRDLMQRVRMISSGKDLRML